MSFCWPDHVYFWLQNLVNLKELRLNDNMIESIPEFLALCKRYEHDTRYTAFRTFIFTNAVWKFTNILIMLFIAKFSSLQFLKLLCKSLVSLGTQDDIKRSYPSNVVLGYFFIDYDLRFAFQTTYIQSFLK